MPNNSSSTDANEVIGVGECPEHGIVAEPDNATIKFPTTAECYCGQELLRATVADPQTVENHV